jgi:hypothetical protein
VRLKLFRIARCVAAATIILWPILPGETFAQQVSNTPPANQNATAGATPRLSDGHPDLNGFWANGMSADTPAGSFFGEPSKGIVRGDGKRAKAQMADPNQPPYKPELMAKVSDFAKNESKDDPAFFCKPGGVPRIGPPHGIVQMPGTAMPIVLLYTLAAGNTFRLIPTDGRPHNPTPEASYNGDAIGHWEGDTLVIDSVGFIDDTWLGLFGWFHSEKMHVVERISRDGDSLHYQATVEDPDVFTKAWTMNAWTSKRTAELIMENPPCIETDIDHITSFDEKTKTK